MREIVMKWYSSTYYLLVWMNVILQINEIICFDDLGCFFK